MNKLERCNKVNIKQILEDYLKEHTALMGLRVMMGIVAADLEICSHVATLKSIAVLHIGTRQILTGIATTVLIVMRIAGMNTV
jgi:hypothetical protein